MNPTALFALTLAVAAGIGSMASGCTLAREPSEEVAGREDGMTPLDRLLLGQAAAYPVDPSLRDKLPELRASQTARRREAWAIARKVLEPVAIDGEARSIPRFQTWYAKDEVLPMFDRLLRGQTAKERENHVPPSGKAIAEAFQWEASRATSSPDWSEERLARRRAELEADGTASLGGPERVMMSPEMVGHLYAHYDKILGCMGNVPASSAAPPSETNFAPCVGEEFPPGAVVVKARWVPDTLPLEAFDTSADALAKVLEAGDWGTAPRTAAPDDRGIYTMRLPSGIRMRLAALHIASKELRDWFWISLFWSDAPNSDFGADRPPALSGPFGHYKMCTAVDFDEADEGSVRPRVVGEPSPAESLADALATTRAFGPRSWCSNPYLEHGANAAKTNCIGCHQHGGTTHTSSSILEGPLAFPDGSREKIRTNFPADYTFITGTGLELASLLKAKVDQLAQ